MHLLFSLELVISWQKNSFDFDFRAIDLTQRHPQYLDVVVAYRTKYLKDYAGGKKETNPKYLQAMKNVSELDFNLEFV